MAYRNRGPRPPCAVSVRIPSGDASSALSANGAGIRIICSSSAWHAAAAAAVARSSGNARPMAARSSAAARRSSAVHGAHSSRGSPTSVFSGTEEQHHRRRIARQRNAQDAGRAPRCRLTSAVTPEGCSWKVDAAWTAGACVALQAANLAQSTRRSELPPDRISANGLSPLPGSTRQRHATGREQCADRGHPEEERPQHAPAARFPCIAIHAICARAIDFCRAVRRSAVTLDAIAGTNECSARRSGAGRRYPRA